ncbi:undecaprenyl/decaprenyl-phosphate alpha-N-acetylglucosaminyl 1-phosphate transferase [Dyella sedimenti]|uniref:undecaprenyl/decaprenyl-phosphate alpha-N-acetylglucosaminyl 1-phosphate transferase n=1 Tax=Dyella sedimenti TaxID=2919947 RepID=UPI001FAA9ECF|nr:undecaprenyl/decaprenyl-phosphate alpha-N-acetylglucosaminyl 1-phosphate transferase [Dyella sedimenti]
MDIVGSCGVAAGASTIAICVLYKLAEPLGLIDRPDERKRHAGNIPLIGGLAAFIGILAGAFCYGEFRSFGYSLLGTASLLAFVGALDDRHNLKVRTRLFVQVSTILLMIGLTNTYIRSLGHLFGHELTLGVFGIPFTVIAVIGLVNAFNMMDGIDGLAGCVTLVSIGAIIALNGQPHTSRATAMLALVAFATLPYLAANFGVAGRKIFLGDAGSTLVGYILAWILIQLSQQNSSQLSSVDVLWCVALPVLDTLAVMYRRIRAGKSPFKPDRGHIHHLLLQAGLGPRATLIVLIAAATTLVTIGSLTRRLEPGSNLLAFSILLVVYVTVTSKVARKLANRAGVPVVPSAMSTTEEPSFASTQG